MNDTSETPMPAPLTIDSRIAKVICMEDRAQIERRATTTVPAGVVKLSLPRMSPLAVDRSVKVEVSGGALTDTRLERSWIETPKGGLKADASALKQKQHRLTQQLAESRDRLEGLNAREEVLAAAVEELDRSIRELSGVGQVDPAQWSAQEAKLSEQSERIAQAIADESRTHDRLSTELDETRLSIAAGEAPEQVLDCRLQLTVDGNGGELTIRITYLVPCAVWRPAYRASLSPSSAVKLEAEAMIWQRTGEDWTQAELWCSTARPTLGTTPPRLSVDRLSLRQKLTEEKRHVEVALREEVIATTGEGGEEPELPGVDDGGETRLIKASALATVHCDGQPHRVPLFSFDTPAVLERSASPELSPLVYLVARFTNPGPNVLLAGPVDLVRASGFIGRGQLKFAAPNETLALSFGSEDAVRIVRSLEEKRDETRITGRRSTVKTVKLFVSNAGAEPQKIVLNERIVVSEVKEVEVQVHERECKPAPQSISKEGIARFELDLAANSQQELRFVWEVQAAGKVQGL